MKEGQVSYFGVGDFDKLRYFGVLEYLLFQVQGIILFVVLEIFIKIMGVTQDMQIYILMLRLMVQTIQLLQMAQHNLKIMVQVIGIVLFMLIFYLTLLIHQLIN